MRRLFSLICMLQIAMSLLAQVANQPIRVTDMLAIKNISNVQLSPDASQVLMSVTSIVPEGDNGWDYQYQTQIWLASLRNQFEPRPLTAGRESASQGVWSPDGKQILFVRPVDGKSQLWLLSLQGGEATQVTKQKYGASNPQYSPDGQYIIFTAGIPIGDLLSDTAVNPKRLLPLWSMEKPGLNASFQTKGAIKPDPNGNMDQVRAYLALNEKDKKAKVIDKLNFQQESTTSGDMSITHVFAMKASPLAEPKRLTEGFTSMSVADILPDGRIIIGAAADLTQHPDRSLSNGVYTMQLDGSDFKPWLKKDSYSYNANAVSPDGKWVSVQHGPDGFVRVPALSILPVDGKASDLVTIPLDRNKQNVQWNGNEQLFFVAPSKGGNVLYQYQTKSKSPRPITPADAGISSFDVQDNVLVYVKTSVQNPFELYMADANGVGEQRVTKFNEDWVRTKRLSVPEAHRFVNEKGMEIDYWVMKPADFQPGKKYPAILDIHGGPSAMWGPGESSMWHEFQYFCSQGYVVVYGNPRGSGGYGEAFLRGNVNDWGAGPAKDVLSSLDKAIEGGFIDDKNLFITGGSYAGYLVAWIIAHDKRFKAACSQRGVYDLRTFFGEGNAWRLVPNYFGGNPWDPATKTTLERESPINYVQNITTPYIIFHGENDLRTGVIQSEQMFRSLKVLNRPVEYVRHPGATHEITRTGNNRQRIDQMLRTWEFFERYRNL